MSNSASIPNIEFTSKKMQIVDRYGEIHDYIKVPVIKRIHCDMNFFRSHKSGLSGFSNSEFFDGMVDAIVRKLLKLESNRLLRVDKLPECVKASPLGNGYFYGVGISLPE